MTQNQIAYQNYLESARANKAREIETTRSNIARETEDRRSHLAQENLSSKGLAETTRSNRARESETLRSNLARESETARSNRAREAEDRRSNLAKELETNRSNLAREAETYRANTQSEAIARSKNDIAKYSADQSYASRIDSAYINRHGVSPTTIKTAASNIGTGIKKAVDATNKNPIAKTVIALPLAVTAKAVKTIAPNLAKTIVQPLTTKQKTKSSGGTKNVKETVLR